MDLRDALAVCVAIREAEHAPLRAAGPVLALLFAAGFGWLYIGDAMTAPEGARTLEAEQARASG